jgi:hypothetical protein
MIATSPFPDWTSRPKEAHWRIAHLSDQANMSQIIEVADLAPATIESSAHSFDSSLREQALVHIFLGQLLAFMWRNGGRDIEVLKSEVDRGGYDVVLESNGIIRHIQLKSSTHFSWIVSRDSRYG